MSLTPEEAAEIAYQALLRVAPELRGRVFRRVIRTAPVTSNDKDWFRAGGDCICPACGLPYYAHGNVPGEEWLTILCSGQRVKL